MVTTLALGRRTNVERKVLTLLRGERAGTPVQRRRTQAAPTPAQAREFTALRRHADAIGLIIAPPRSPYLSLDELHLLAWLAGAQRVMPPYGPPRGDAAFLATITRCAILLDSMGLHLSPLTLYSARLRSGSDANSTAQPAARRA